MSLTMLDPRIQKKLESLHQIPTIPTVATEVLHALDNPKTGAGWLAKLIERDQALTARVLSVANSPLYGFSQKVSTINLAVVVLGTEVIKEILLSLIIKGVFSSAKGGLLSITSFWQYSVFCGSTARYLARRFGYRVVGEAFVAGLMHDIGILVIAQAFPRELVLIRREQQKIISLYEAEKKILGCTHCEIGAWVAHKWNFPAQLQNAILMHHTVVTEEHLRQEPAKALPAGGMTRAVQKSALEESKHPLAVVVALAEWVAGMMNFKQWAMETKQPPLHVPKAIAEDIMSHEMLDANGALQLFKTQLMEEYERASVLSNLSA